MEVDNELATDDFNFESDHLALRENEDYKNVLRTIALLESQRMNISQELEELMDMQRKFANNPQLLIKKLRTGQPLMKNAKLVIIPDLPELLGKYENLKKPKPGIKDEKEHPTVRGRAIDETKPETFNQLWTCDEQRRLEELLLKYPPEQKEMRRYSKIAQELGNRTPQQVCSRVQKYFLKLHDAGIPIPGRMPKARRLIKQTKQKNIFKSSTFFPSLNVPVSMPSQDDEDSTFYMPYLKSEPSTDDDEDNADNAETRPISTAPSVSSASDMMAIEANRQNDLKIQMLKVIRNEKFVSTGYQPDPMALSCEDCQSVAVSRTSWRCNTCYTNLNLCCDCLIHRLINDQFEHITHEVVSTVPNVITSVGET